MSPFSQYSIIMYSFRASLSNILKRYKQPMPHLLIVVSDDIRMIELLEDVDLADDLLSLSITHTAVVELFPDEDLSIRLSLNPIHRSETA